MVSTKIGVGCSIGIFRGSARLQSSGQYDVDFAATLADLLSLRCPSWLPWLNADVDAARSEGSAGNNKGKRKRNYVQLRNT